jgi:hypothetical protein
LCDTIDSDVGFLMLVCPELKVGTGYPLYTSTMLLGSDFVTYFVTYLESPAVVTYCTLICACHIINSMGVYKTTY